MKKSFLKNTVQFALGIGLVAVAVAFTGCQTPTSSNDIKFTTVDDPDAPTMMADQAMTFAKDDLVIITFSGQQDLQPHEERIKEDGTITLQYIGSIKAEGKTTGELQREIHDAYVPTYYKRLTPTVKTDRQIYYVQGQVRQSGRQEYLGPTTVLKAIASAGDFTDFASRKRVRLNRKDGSWQIIDCNKAAEDPSLDLPVFPGDKIDVPARRPFEP
jgi:protein involved in polysaccharide export with SLBB domain